MIAATAATIAIKMLSITSMPDNTRSWTRSTTSNRKRSSTDDCRRNKIDDGGGESGAERDLPR
jgi:hypothetical protein